MTTSYKIVRFYADDRTSKVVKHGLTLDEAQAHCHRNDTQGDGWFDGYTEETSSNCQHCGRTIVLSKKGHWIDPEAKGDDRIWRRTCDSHDTFEADHEPRGGVA